MNRTYRSIWNQALGAWVAVSELASARGKPGKVKMLAAVTLAAASFAPSHAAYAQAVPAGGTASDPSGIAIGLGASGNGGAGTIAIGSLSSTTATNQISIGTGAKVSIGSSIAIGSSAVGTGLSSAAVGASASAAGILGASSFGSSASTSFGSSIAMGSGANAAGSLTTAVGSGASAGDLGNYGSGAAIGSNSVTGTALPTGSGYLTLTAAPISAVSVGSATALRRITNVADGAAPQDAVTVSQLSSGVSTLTSSIASLSNGNLGLVQQVGAGAITLAASTGGASADFTGTAGPRQLNGVADGTALTDAVNLGQLQAVASAASNVVLYDDASHTRATLGGLGAAAPIALTNVAAGAITATSTDAVNGSQLYSLQTQVDALQASSGEGALAGTIAVDGSGAASVSTNGVAMGTDAKAGGSNGTAVGGSSFAAGPNDTALGSNAQVNADRSTAMGANAAIAASATNAVAVGESASVTATSGTAIGQGASVTAANAVALGQGSTADVANTVSVGTATNQRQITNVAAGVQATDAANVGQLNQALATAKTYTDGSAQQTLSAANSYTNQAVAATKSNLTSFESQVSKQFQTVNKRIDQAGAISAASTQMAINAAGGTGMGRIAVGVGHQGSHTAVSVGYAVRIGSKAHISFGISSSGSQTSVGTGFGVNF